MIYGKKRLTVNDLDIDYSLLSKQPGRIFQAKASIIYLPGFGCDYLNHQNFSNLLVSYDYYAINAPAHGSTPWYSTEDLTIKKYADLVYEFINMHNLSDVILIGHSSSAAVVALLNGMIPNVIRANVLISPIETSFQADAERVKDILIPRLIDDLEQLLRMQIFNYDIKSFNNPAWDSFKKDKLVYYNKNFEPLSLQLESLLSFELKSSIEQLYASISKPTLVVFGDSDGLIRINDVANKMRGLIPNAKISIISMAGHEPALDNPNNYYSNVITFIDQIILNFDENNFQQLEGYENGQ